VRQAADIDYRYEYRYTNLTASTNNNGQNQCARYIQQDKHSEITIKMKWGSDTAMCSLASYTDATDMFSPDKRKPTEKPDVSFIMEVNKGEDDE